MDPVRSPKIKIATTSDTLQPPLVEASNGVDPIAPAPVETPPEEGVAPVVGRSSSDATKGYKTDHEKALELTRHIEEGKKSVPSGHEPLVCKPRQIESWRIFKIMSEFVEGFELLSKYGLAASFFGTARECFNEQMYKDAEDLAARLAKRGFAVITGGNNGIMRAANKGAFEAGGASVGLNINLPEEAQRNEYLTDFVLFEHFFVRKVMLVYASEVYIVFPGGFGTLDEFFEILTLVQTKKLRKVPLVLYGRDYWQPLVENFKTKLLDEYHAINAEDMELFVVVNTVDEAYTYITTNVKC